MKHNERRSVLAYIEGALGGLFRVGKVLHSEQASKRER